MAKFRFRFEAVENVRKQAERQALRALAEAQAMFHEEQQKKADLQASLQKSLQRRERLGDQSVDQIVAYQLESEFVSGTKQRILQQDQAIFRARKRLENALRNYLHAKRHLKAMEVLREKDFQEYKTALRKREQKQLDELYVMRARFSEERF